MTLRYGSLTAVGLATLVLSGASPVALGGSTVTPTLPTVCGTSTTAARSAEANASYYAIDLVPTKRVPGTGAAKGTAQVTFARSPFSVSVAAGGTYAQALDIRIEGLRPTSSGVFVAWAARADLEQAVRLGVLDTQANGHLAASVEWNKFLVVVSLEPSADTLGDQWQGPIVMRGMSRSGLMHTMAGHGPFESESCLKYGYR